MSISKNVLYIINETEVDTKEKTSWYKIGITVDLTSRLRQHQTSNPRVLGIEHVFYFGHIMFAEIVEKAILVKIKEMRLVTRGEWVKVDSIEDLKELIQVCIDKLNSLLETFQDFIDDL